MRVFTLRQEDVFKELINISFGLAASLIGDVVKSQANLHIPKIQIIDVENLDQYITETLENDKPYYVTRQLFRNNFDGESLFILCHTDALLLSKRLFHRKTEFREMEIRSAVLELTNIITSACIGKLSEVMKNSTYFEAPQVENIMKNTPIIEFNDKIKYDKVIVLETILDIEEINIHAVMYILIKEEALDWLIENLNKFIK